MRALFAAVMTTALLAACSDSGTNPDAAGPAPGNERGPCYPNKTCNPGLSCLSDLCVRVPDSGARDGSPPDAPRDAAPQPDTPVVDSAPDQPWPDLAQPDASLVPPSWTAMQSKHTQALFAVWGTGKRDVYAAGNGGTILHFDGAKPPAFSWWTQVATGSTTYWDIWGASPHDIYVFGHAGLLQHFDGTTWSSLNTGGGSAQLGAWGSAAAGVYVAGDIHILHSDRGLWPPVWSKTVHNAPGVQQLLGIWGSGPKEIHVVGAKGTMLRYDGSGWKPVVSNTTASLYGVWGSGSSNIIAVGNSGTIIRYDGTTWKQMISNTTADLQAVWGSGPGDVFAVGKAGTIVRYDGTTWKPMTSGTALALYDVWGAGPADVYAVGAQGTILHFGSCDCVVNSLCYGAGDRDDTGCKVCLPALSSTKLSAPAGGCAIGTGCQESGEQDATGCKVCDPSQSKTSWTAVTGGCSIGGLCHASGAGGKTFCMLCDPAKSAGAWSLAAKTCQIKGVCLLDGAKDGTGCQVCDPSQSTSAWTGVTGGCKIDGTCHVKGAKHSAGCAECDPAKSATAWTVTGSGCLIDDACYASGAKTSDGCGECQPASSKTAWTLASGCLVMHGWSKGLGGGGWDELSGVALDGSGNIYVTGTFQYDIDLGGGTLTGKGGTDLFVASFTAAGAHRWSKVFGGGNTDYGRDIAVDGSGNVYITGRFTYDIDFGGGKLTGKNGTDLFVASFTSAGVHRWSMGAGDYLSDSGERIVTDGSGNVYVTGSYYSSVDLGGGKLTSKGSRDFYLVKLSSSGTHLWSKSFGSVDADDVYGLSIDASGNLYLAGSHQASLSLGGSTFTTKGSYDAFAASFTSGGAHRWSASYGGVASDYAYDIVTDGGGNIYLTGGFSSSISFGGATLTTKGSNDIFLASFTPTGAHRWSAGFGSVASESGHDLAVDASGNLYAVGVFYGPTSLGGSTFSPAGSSDLFIASFTSTGSHRWSRAHGAAGQERGETILVDAKGGVLVGGSHSNGTDFGGGALSAKGSNDAFLLKLVP